MGKIETFEQFLVNSSVQVSLKQFIINFIVAVILSTILEKVYIKYGQSLSSRKIFSKNFFILTLTTMLTISIVKSSLALSLGLVGALSIVRFRAAIKEPEELLFLFLSISIGLGLGADQIKITCLAFFLITAVIIAKSYFSNGEGHYDNLYITVNSSGNIDPQSITDAIKKNCETVDLKRLNSSNEEIEMSFMIQFNEFEKLMLIRSELTKLNKDIEINFMDNRVNF